MTITPIGVHLKQRGRLPRGSCPVCQRKRVWIELPGDAPLMGCPYDEELMDGGKRTINSDRDCPWIVGMETAAAERRRLWPQAFDENGKIKPDGWNTILTTCPAQT